MKTMCGFLALVAALMVVPDARSQSSEPKVGERPPTIGLEKLLQAPEGTKASWAALKGKVVVPEFWATWCGTCVAAMPHLNDRADQLKEHPTQFIVLPHERE